MINYDFSGKEILITGGISGIGLETAKKFSELGGKVTITYRRNSSYENYKKLSKDQYDITIQKLDITNELSIEQLYKKIDRLDILVNNATLIKGGVEYRVENFSDVVNVNLMGVMRVCHMFMPKLALSEGNIINVTSANVKLPLATAPSYIATKAGIEALTKSMASCWAEHKLRVNSVAPGWIETNTTNILKKDMHNFKNILERIPLKRIGKADDVANTVIFLSSDMATYITGSTIFVDGGFSIN